MIDYEQRTAIAEACGLHPGDKTGCGLPDYPNDLNAMHEAERYLPALHWDRYAQWLRELTHSNRRFLIAHATAEQRAEAFLRVIGKWQDSEPSNTSESKGTEVTCKD